MTRKMIRVPIEATTPEEAFQTFKKYLEAREYIPVIGTVQMHLNGGACRYEFTADIDTPDHETK